MLAKLKLFALVLLAGLTTLPRAVYAQEEKPASANVLVELYAAPILTDWSGLPVQFHDDPAPVHFALLVQWQSTPLAKNAEEQAVRAAQEEQLLRAFGASVTVDGQRLPAEQIELQTQGKDTGNTFYGDVEVKVKGGWPPAKRGLMPGWMCLSCWGTVCQ